MQSSRRPRPVKSATARSLSTISSRRCASAPVNRGRMRSDAISQISTPVRDHVYGGFLMGTGERSMKILLLGLALLPGSAWAQSSVGVVDTGEIGIASCRERVCQYVYISVVAVSLKNKKEYIA